MNRGRQTDHRFLQIKGNVCFGFQTVFDDAIQATAIHWANLPWNSYDNLQVPFLDDYELRVLHIKLRGIVFT